MPLPRQADTIETFSQTAVFMDTHVSLTVISEGGTDQCEERAARAFQWFRRVEECCSRFDPRSELMQLTARSGVPVSVSPLLFDAARFALAVAEESGGAFDPTVGYALERHGFNRNYLTGERISTPLEHTDSCSYRDVRLDADHRTITLLKPLILDLGAVAKGLAVDLAARDLSAFPGFAIDAGGDLFLGGRNARGEPWRVGIRHPRQHTDLLATLGVSGVAVCTSGDYDRVSASGDDRCHIIDPRTGAAVSGVASVTVVGPTAMLADALGTAAFVLGPLEGIDWLERHGVEGMIVTTALERYETSGFARYLT